ncbi:MAG: glycosyltransferase family 1 protein [Symploca sp. SIO1A3]|nr:glycosyltransferase family 1 protein [Symploca sp. SIO1A3]
MNTNPSARTLLLSQRQLIDHVSYCCLYEFEDLIREIDTVDLVTPTNSYDFSKQVFTWVKRFTRSAQFAQWITPDPNPVVLDQEYDLFFNILAGPGLFLAVDSIKNWRKKCKKAVCYIVEIWENSIPGWRPILELLKDFDHIFLGVSHATEAVAEITGVPCSYLPPSVDTIKFCPYLPSPHRDIDVCYIGRRSAITHQVLLELAKQKKFFYYYDTAKRFHVLDPNEHRTLLANLTKRSRYLIANKANANEPHKTGKHTEIGYRFFEGAAAGAVMIGEPPATEQFNKYFDWSDAVIPIPFDAPNIGDVIAELDAQPERLEKISQDNVVNSLLRHDWVYRWRQVLEAVDIQPTPQLLDREAHLKHLAEQITLGTMGTLLN